MRTHLHTYARRIYAQAFLQIPGLRESCLITGLDASYAISFRQASALPAASFRFHLAMDTLAVRLTVPPAGLVKDLHLQVGAPCRAHQKKAGTL